MALPGDALVGRIGSGFVQGFEKGDLALVVVGLLVGIPPFEDGAVDLVVDLDCRQLQDPIKVRLCHLKVVQPSTVDGVQIDWTQRCDRSTVVDGIAASFDDVVFLQV